MNRMSVAAGAVACAALWGCYRADVTTGLAPSGAVVEDAWVLGFAGGLVMVDDVDASECRNGIARLMTRQSFMNLVVNVLTAGIVSPMSVRVECAARPGTPLPAVSGG